MNLATVGVGIAALLIGAYSTYERQAHPDRMRKLQAMQSQWGEKTGFVVHVIFYSVVPLLFGIMALIIGASGGSIF